MLKIVRVTEHDSATFGVMMVGDKPEFVTLEESWRDNERMVSCIPQGRYKIKLHRSPKFGLCYKVMDVPERSEILIHVGNTNADTTGCILLGQRFGPVGDRYGISGSKLAMTRFMQLMSGISEADLVIISAYGGGRVH
jgi:hypothetical protein